MEERRAPITRAYDRCWCPEGVARQYAAVIAIGSRAELLEAILVPVLVIHGTNDYLLPIEHGRGIADNIIGTEFIEVDCLGHDLEGAISEIVVAGTTHLARIAKTHSPSRPLASEVLPPAGRDDKRPLSRAR